MKHLKIIIALALALSATSAFASTKQVQEGGTLYLVTYEDTDFNLNGILDEVSRVDITPRGNQDPMAVTQSWGLTGYETPRVAIGTTVTDRYGFSATCDAWIPKYLGCFDISNTEEYLAGIRATLGIK